MPPFFISSFVLRFNDCPITSPSAMDSTSTQKSPGLLLCLLPSNMISLIVTKTLAQTSLPPSGCRRWNTYGKMSAMLSCLRAAFGATHMIFKVFHDRLQDSFIGLGIRPDKIRLLLSKLRILLQRFLHLHASGFRDIMNVVRIHSPAESGCSARLGSVLQICRSGQCIA